MDHDEAVTQRYIVAENRLDDAYWTDVHREKEYFENHDEPIDNGNIPNKGRCVGECDLLFVNEEDKIARYEELKTSYGDLYKANDQTERFEDFFDETEWELYTDIILVE